MHEYKLTPRAEQDEYLSSPEGRQHVAAIAAMLDADEARRDTLTQALRRDVGLGAAIEADEIIRDEIVAQFKRDMSGVATIPSERVKIHRAPAGGVSLKAFFPSGVGWITSALYCCGVCVAHSYCW